MISPDAESTDVLVAGATGSLGRALVTRLAAKGVQVRALVRDPASAKRLLPATVQLAPGDVRDPAAVATAVAGARAVVSVVTGFARGGGPQAVDHLGNRNLVAAAQELGVQRFVLTSIVGAAAGHPQELYRMKAAAERDLRASGLAWTVLRPTVLMGTWAELAGRAIATGRPVPVVGRGHNPVNFVAEQDLAALIDAALADPRLVGEVIEAGGPENLTMNELIRTFELATGRRARVRRIPLGAARAARLVLGPVAPTAARILDAAIAMDTTDMTFDDAPLRHRFPQLPLTTLAEIAAAAYGSDAAPGVAGAKPRGA